MYLIDSKIYGTKINVCDGLVEVPEIRCDEIADLYNALCDEFPQFRTRELRSLYGGSKYAAIFSARDYLNDITKYDVYYTKFAEMYTLAAIISSQLKGLPIYATRYSTALVVGRNIITFDAAFRGCDVIDVYQIKKTSAVETLNEKLNEHVNDTIGVARVKVKLRKAIGTFLENRPDYETIISGECVKDMDYGLYYTEKDAVEFFLQSRYKGLRFEFNIRTEEYKEIDIDDSRVIFFERDTLKPRED